VHDSHSLRDSAVQCSEYIKKAALSSLQFCLFKVVKYSIMTRVCLSSNGLKYTKLDSWRFASF